MWSTGFINNETYYIIDGAAIGSNCTSYSPYQFSYNAGGFILGAAAMYNHTESKVWKDRLDGLIRGSKVFFTGDNLDIMTEVACESVDRCNTDQQSFKAYLSRWLAAATQWAPDIYSTVIPYLQASAKAAINQCVGGSNGRMCGLKWANNGQYDGTTGVGQQMAALEVLLSTTIKDRAAPLTADTGGTSKGDVNAGSGDIGRTNPVPVFKPPTAGDKAGGAFLTLFIVAGIVGALTWLLLDETSDKKMIPQVKGSLANMKAVLSGGQVAGGGFVAAAAAGARSGDSSPHMAEKGAQTGVQSLSSRSSHISNEKSIEDTPVTVGNVQNTSGSNSRRSSNMPLGWPRNSVVRPGPIGQAVSAEDVESTPDDVDRITPVSTYHAM